MIQSKPLLPDRSWVAINRFHIGPASRFNEATIHNKLIALALQPFSVFYFSASNTSYCDKMTDISNGHPRSIRT